MPSDLERYHRRSIRLRGYDYAQPGTYFVTVCTQDRACLFGQVADGTMRLDAVGQMVERWWLELPRKFAGVQTDVFIVMPNHIHGIIIVGADLRVCPPPVGPDPVGADPVGPDPVGADLRVCPETDVRADLRVCPKTGAHTGAPTEGGAHTGAPTEGGAHTGAPTEGGAHTGAPLPRVVQWFKTMTTNEYIRRVRTDRWPPFRGRLWQRNYYERIIRTDREWDRIRRYIAENPVRWHLDRDNPNRSGTDPEDAQWYQNR